MSSLIKIMFFLLVVVLSSTNNGVNASAASDDYVINPVIIDGCPAIVARDPTISIDECLFLLSAIPETNDAHSLNALGLGVIQYVKGHLAFTVSDLVDKEDCIQIYSDVFLELSNVEVEYTTRNLQAVDVHIKAVIAASDSCVQKIKDAKNPRNLAEESHNLSFGALFLLSSSLFSLALLEIRGTNLVAEAIGSLCSPTAHEHVGSPPGLLESRYSSTPQDPKSL